ncbi:unnamed protein product [Prorocentrum cordatum]|uniref:Cyclic nucleotide-binding domain-containing protein n=1 Tax=Prorocentrum cordatum TaxID=2364126 RepID=A0ABN9SSC1_9DINO|nr:unnamed protein product [Polarella glacialis]
MAPLQRRPRPASPTLLAQRAAYQAQLGRSGGSLSSSAPVLPALADAASRGALALPTDRSSRSLASLSSAAAPRPLKSLLPADHPAEASCWHGTSALLRRCREFEASGKDTDCQTSCAPRKMRGLDLLYFQSVDPLEEGGPGRTRRRSSITGVDEKQRRIRAALKSVKLFSDLDSKNPGLIAQLAQEASVQRFAEDFVIFRQGDPPKNCYVVMRGKAGVYIHRRGMRYEDTRPSPADGGDEPDNDDGSVCSSPRSPMSPTRAGRRRRRAGPTPRNAKGLDMKDRFKTAEGFSSFNKHSVFGKCENVLGPGMLFGETALDNDDSRNATIKCEEDLEALAIPKKYYKRAMAQVNAQKDFICSNLPGAQFGYRLTHPATFFVLREFKQGHAFLHEAVRASERAVFCVFSGQVEVRRYRRATDNPAYVLAHRPLDEASWKSRCPPPPMLADSALSLARPSDGAPKAVRDGAAARASATSVSSSFNMPGQIDEGGSGFGEDDFGPTLGGQGATGAKCPADQVAIDVVEKGACFCPLSFYPLPGAEPFTMVAVTETVRVLCASEQDVKAFPAKFAKAMRNSLMQDMTRRLKAVKRMDLETAQDVARPEPEPPSPSPKHLRRPVSAGSSDGSLLSVGQVRPNQPQCTGKLPNSPVFSPGTAESHPWGMPDIMTGETRARQRDS